MRLLSIGCDTRYSENTQIGLAGRNESGDLIRHGPQDTSWGERYFHMRDPDGHELSFAPAVAASGMNNGEPQKATPRGRA